MIFPNKIYFNHSQNRMNNEGDTVSSRKYFFEKKNKNLFHLLKNRFSWMNNFIKENDNIVELGSGPAFVKEFINNKNFKTSDIIGDDFIDHKGIDAMNTRFDDKSFSVVISSNLIHHVAHPIKLFNEVHRILKPGGIYIIQDVNFSFMMKMIILLMKIEGYDETVNILDDKTPCNDVNDPWSGNNAIPNLIFENFEQFNKKLDNNFEIIHSSKNEFMIFLNSGGVIAKTFYIPLNEFMNKFLIKIDNQLTKVHKIFALQQSIVIKKIN
jgi:ubiquinone/menaquinone biosynthesis C-methylase UbiE